MLHFSILLLLVYVWLLNPSWHTFRRISKGSAAHSTKGPITPLRDSDQPFIFDITFFNCPYRFEFYDSSSPDNWTLLQPHVIVLCYDISSRLSLINIQRLVSHPVPISLHHLLNFIFFISVEKRSHENLHTGERDSNIDAWFEERSQKWRRSKWNYISSGRI